MLHAALPHAVSAGRALNTDNPPLARSGIAIACTARCRV